MLHELNFQKKFAIDVMFNNFLEFPLWLKYANIKPFFQIFIKEW